MKKQIALAAVLAAAITFTGCGLTGEHRGNDNAASTTNNSSFSSNSSEKTDSSDSKSDPTSTPSVGVSYEPVINEVGDIVTSGNYQYFEYTSEYGNAYTSIYRYIFNNGKFDGAALKILPGTVTDLKTILESDPDGSVYNVSDFSEVIDGWSMTKEALEFESTFQNMSIESFHSLMKLSMSSNSDTSDTYSDSNAEIDYEPEVNRCGDIMSDGDTQYFDAYTEYGNACTIVYRYIFKNGLFDHATMKIKPCAETNLDNILNSFMTGDNGIYDVTDFVDDGDGWTLIKDGFGDEANSIFAGADIYSCHALMQSMQS